MQLRPFAYIALAAVLVTATSVQAIPLLSGECQCMTSRPPADVAIQRRCQSQSPPGTYSALITRAGSSHALSQADGTSLKARDICSNSTTINLDFVESTGVLYATCNDIDYNTYLELAIPDGFHCTEELTGCNGVAACHRDLKSCHAAELYCAMLPGKFLCSD